MTSSSGSNEGEAEEVMMAPLAIDQADPDTQQDHDNDSSSSTSNNNLDQRILATVRKAPHRTIRPARLAAELGISVNDACAELCGLLAAVGGGEHGASFTFETTTTTSDGHDADDDDDAIKTPPKQQHIMVFTFPPDFEKRARRNRQKQDVWIALENFLQVAFRFLKVMTAFGLILSLLILCIAAIVSLFALIVAMSRGDHNQRGGGQQQHRTLLMRQIRSLVFTLRQLLWFYAVFGPDTEGQHPFLREIAYDISLVLSCCCGNPASLFYWLRASQLSRRRHRIARGWRSDGTRDSDIEGVTLVRRGSWGDSESSTGSRLPSITDEGYRGLLSVAVEFLFGPTPSSSSRDKMANLWKLRGAFLVKESSKNGGVSLEALSPYLDYPPKSLEDGGRSTIVEQGLVIVAHFNGMPRNENSSSSNIDMTKAQFIFPELMAESEVSLQYKQKIDDDDGTFENFLYDKHNGGTSSIATMSSSLTLEYYQEERYRFTKLSAQQLCSSVSLGVLNLLGVIWFGQSIGKGGVLELQERSALSIFLNSVLLPILRGYGMLFLALPAARLFVLMILNRRLAERNRRRQRLAKLLSSQ